MAIFPYGDWRYLTSANDVADLPAPYGREAAFYGRSNVGKSSLINMLTRNRKLARASNSPGRTQLLNFFGTRQAELVLVDLPGYGYAKAPPETAAQWQRLVRGYLHNRENLSRVMLLIDSRIGFKSIDKLAMDFMDTVPVHYQIIFTKSDKISAAMLADRKSEAISEIERRPAAFPQILISSALNAKGVESLEAALAPFCDG